MKTVNHIVWGEDLYIPVAYKTVYHIKKGKLKLQHSICGTGHYYGWESIIYRNDLMICTSLSHPVRGMIIAIYHNEPYKRIPLEVKAYAALQQF